MPENQWVAAQTLASDLTWDVPKIQGPNDPALSWWSTDQAAEDIIEIARRFLSPWRLHNYSILQYITAILNALTKTAAASQTGDGEAYWPHVITICLYGGTGGTTAILCSPEDGVIDDTGVMEFTSPTWQRKRLGNWRQNMRTSHHYSYGH